MKKTKKVVKRISKKEKIRREKISKSLKRYWRKEKARRRKISESLRRYWEEKRRKEEERRRKISESLKKYHEEKRKKDKIKKRIERKREAKKLAKKKIEAEINGIEGVFTAKEILDKLKNFKGWVMIKVDGTKIKFYLSDKLNNKERASKILNQLIKMSRLYYNLPKANFTIIMGKEKIRIKGNKIQEVNEAIEFISNLLYILWS